MTTTAKKDYWEKIYEISGVVEDESGSDDDSGDIVDYQAEYERGQKIIAAMKLIGYPPAYIVKESRYN